MNEQMSTMRGEAEGAVSTQGRRTNSVWGSRKASPPPPPRASGGTGDGENRGRGRFPDGQSYLREGECIAPAPSPER